MDIVLIGNLHACLEYSQVTKGKGLEDAYRDLRPQLQTYEDAGSGALEEDHPFRDPTPWAHLLWGFSGTWRAEDGWNDAHAFSEDIGTTVSESKRFQSLMKDVTFAEFREARPVLLELLLLTLFLPENLDSKKKVSPPLES